MMSVEQLRSQRRDAFSRRAIVAAASLLPVAWATPGRAAPPSTTRKPDSMTDARITTYETYLSAWSAMPDNERAKLLSGSLSEDIVFTNPTQTRRGWADVAVHLQAFQERSPGAGFQMNEMVGWESNALVTWQFVDAQGQPGFLGYDVLVYDQQGLIESILLFSRVEKQTLK